MKKFINKQKSSKSREVIEKTIIQNNVNSKLTVAQNFTYMFKMMSDKARGRYKDLATPKFLLAILSILYVVSPLDFVPDYILGLGWLDDITIATIGWKTISDAVYNYKLWNDVENSMSEQEKQNNEDEKEYDEMIKNIQKEN